MEVPPLTTFQPERRMVILIDMIKVSRPICLFTANPKPKCLQLETTSRKIYYYKLTLFTFTKKNTFHHTTSHCIITAVEQFIMIGIMGGD